MRTAMVVLRKDLRLELREQLSQLQAIQRQVEALLPREQSATA